MAETAEACDSYEPDDSFFRTLVELMPQMAWTKDAQGRNEYGNPSFLEFLDITNDEFVHNSWIVVYPDDVARGQAAWRVACETGSPYEVELRLRPRGATAYRWFLVRAVPYVNAVGRIERWFGTTTDIDAQRRAFTALDVLAHDLQAFADLGESMSEAVGVNETIAAALRTIVPRRADAAFVTLADDRGEVRGAEDVAAEVLQTREPVWSENSVVVPLFSGTLVRGTVHLEMSATDRAFARSDVDFFQEFARRLAPAIANAELFERERRVARSFQDAALPAALPVVPGFAFDAIYEAGRAEALVGGDWYDAFLVKDGRIVISIGDVAGSGLMAAVTMASVRQAIRGAAHVQADPSIMLAAADRALQDPEERFVTAFVGVIDPRQATLVYQSAGHPPPLLAYPDGSIVELEGGAPPLGLRFDQTHASRVRCLPHGSLLVLYTDGLIESTRDVVAGESRLRETVRNAAIRNGPNPASGIHDAMLSDGSRDDVAILTVLTA